MIGLYFLLSPFLLTLVSTLFSNKHETAIYRCALFGAVGNLFVLLVVALLWVKDGFHPLFLHGPLLYSGSEYDIGISFFLDGFGYAYLFAASLLMGMVVVFSRYYVHREKGYKRFFINIQLFYGGLVMVLLAGNFETLFVGWEILGVTSFFLIGFYRERYLPVKNALKVVSLYRIADIAILLAVWLCHHYYGAAIDFTNAFDNTSQPDGHVSGGLFYPACIASLFLLAAMVKSAQFPFSSWLPRAMEGPTTSSAIFYGSLSVHIGVFLLIRTAPIWENIPAFPWIIGSIGILTAMVGTVTSSVQSTIKTQIAYSSATQIGIMFAEVALGLYWLAMIHLICHAFLRSYQLLISPSVLSYRIHDQVFHFNQPKEQHYQGRWNKLKLAFFVLGIKEFNMDSWMFHNVWIPLKKAGKMFHFIGSRSTWTIFIPVLLAGILALFYREHIPTSVLGFLPGFFGIVGLVLALKAFVARGVAAVGWMFILLNQLYQPLIFAFNEELDLLQVYIFLSGIILAGLLGFRVIYNLRKAGRNISLNRFNGNVYGYPGKALVFVFACLAMVGFPVTPTFVGIELLLGNMGGNQFFLPVLVAFNMIIIGLSVYRIYARLFLGPDISDYHDFAYRSS